MLKKITGEKISIVMSMNTQIETIWIGFKAKLCSISMMYVPIDYGNPSANIGKSLLNITGSDGNLNKNLIKK